MPTIAFIGLGSMGAPMARNLLSAGFDVLGVNRSSGPVDAFVADGGRAGGGVGAASAAADIVITMLPDTPDVALVLSGPSGVFESARPDTLVIDMSTIRPDATRELAAEATRRGMRYLDAPVSGGVQGAVEAKLSVMVGAAVDDFATARPVLEAMGSTVVRVGECGAGQTVKAANQIMVAGAIGMLAEAIVFLESQGADMAAALRVLGGGLAGSTVLSRLGDAMVARDYSPRFRVALHHKDLGIFAGSAGAAGVVAPLATQAATLMASLNAQGHGGLDHTALLMLVEQLSGRLPERHDA